ncbi:hypothetical protein AX768_13360 [Burkholderia sp. PAMC 28687]|nr:hypothetical protein AX768_13360 [Burkholderia sp. PAMC 28687]
MPIRFKAPTPAVIVPAKPKRKSWNVQPKAPLISLDQPGYIRNANFQALLGNLSSPAFFQRRKKGLIPPPDGFDPRPFWRTETVKAFLTACGETK